MGPRARQLAGRGELGFGKSWKCLPSDDVWVHGFYRTGHSFKLRYNAGSSLFCKSLAF